jgi:hypothetical protein
MTNRIQLVLSLNAKDLDALRDGFQTIANDFAIDGQERADRHGASGGGYRYSLVVHPHVGGDEGVSG